MTDRKTLAEATVRRFLEDPEFASELSAAFATASSMRLVPATTVPKAPALPLPTVAPRVWADAPAGMRATQFVREVYAPWIEAGVMTQKAIRECDFALYRAYRNRICRHPTEAAPLVRSERADKIADPQVAIDRVREASRQGAARAREKAKACSENAAAFLDTAKDQRPVPPAPAGKKGVRTGPSPV